MGNYLILASEKKLCNLLATINSSFMFSPNFLNYALASSPVFYTCSMCCPYRCRNPFEVSFCCHLLLPGGKWAYYFGTNKIKEQRMKASVHLVFPSPVQSVLPEGSKEDGIITSLSHGVMTVDDYFQCVKHGRAAVATRSNILKKK